MGEGRTPGGVGAGFVDGRGGDSFGTSSPAGARDSATLRLRNAIFGLWRGVSRDFWKMLEGLSIRLALDVMPEAFIPAILRVEPGEH